MCLGILTIMNTNLLIYIIVGVLAIMAGWLGYTEWRLKKFFRGKNARNLEDVFKSITEDLENLHLNRREIEKYLEEVEERLKKSLKQVGLIRFNPFGESGSNQSFSIAFLDELGNGAVISTLYTRDNIKTYAKPIKEYKSEYNLTPEEKEAIWKTK